MVSDFYIAWAYCYDLVNNTRKADEIFRQGIACRAQPLEDLQEAHQHFGFTVAQRLMYKDDDNIQEETIRQMQERRLALSSLRGHRRKQTVGSTRTGAAVKSNVPGVIKVSNISVQNCEAVHTFLLCLPLYAGMPISCFFVGNVSNLYTFMEMFNASN